MDGGFDLSRVALQRMVFKQVKAKKIIEVIANICCKLGLVFLHNVAKSFEKSYSSEQTHSFRYI